MTIDNCPNCGERLRPDVKFCTQCGHKISTKPQQLRGNALKEKDQQVASDVRKHTATTPHPSSFSEQLARNVRTHVSGIRRPSTSQILIPLVGLVGLLLIVTTLTEILELDQLKVPVVWISVGGWVLFVLISALVIFLVETHRLNGISQLLIIILGEAILLSTQFSVDVIARTETNRHLLLVSGIALAIAGGYMGIRLERSLFNLSHQVVTSYVFWILIYYLRGSNYINSSIYSVVILFGLIFYHTISLYQVNPTTMAGYMVFEFLILLQTEVINSSFNIVIAAVMIVQIPVLFRIFETTLSELPSNLWQLVMGLHFLPLLSVVISIGRGAVLPPYPHILFSLLVVVWVAYLYDAQNRNLLEAKVFSLISFSLVSLLSIGGFVYSLYSSELDLVFLIAGVVIAINILSTFEDKIKRHLIQLMSIFLITFANYQILENQSFEVVIPIVLVGELLLLLVAVPFYKGILDDIDVTLGQIAIAGFLFGLYLVDNFPPEYFGIYIVIQVIIYLWQYQRDFTYRYPTIASLILIPGLSFVKYLDQDLSYAYVLLGSQTLLVGLVFFDVKQFQNDLSILSWSLIFLPQIFGWVEMTNHFTINTVAVLFLTVAILSLLVREDTSVVRYSPLFFSILALVLRGIQQGEYGVIFGYDVWMVSLLSILVLNFLLFLTLSMTRDGLSTSIYYHMSYAIGWILSSVFVIEQLRDADFTDVAEMVFYFTQAGIIIYYMVMAGLKHKNSDADDIGDYAFVIFPLLFFLLNFYPMEPVYNWFAWIVFVVVMTAHSFRSDQRDTTVYNYLWILGYLLNLISLFSINNWMAFGGIFLFSLMFFKDNHFRQAGRKTGVDSAVLMLAGHSLILIGITLFKFGNIIETYQAIVCWIFISLLMVSESRNITAQLRPSIYLIAFLNSIAMLIWLVDADLNVLVFGTGVISSLVIIFPLIRDMFTAYPVKTNLPVFNFETFAIAGMMLFWIVSLSWVIIERTTVNVVDLNRGIVMVMSVFVLGTLLYERFQRQSIATNAIIIFSFIGFLLSSLFGFFESPIANIVLGTVAVAISITSLVLKDQRMFIVGFGVSILSLLKGLVDYIILDGIQLQISLLTVGIQMVWYAIIFSNILGQHDNDIRVEKGDQL